MDADTYPQPAVQRLLTESLVPLRLPHDREPQATRYGLRSTPLLLVLDSAGSPVHRLEGVQPADELVPALLLGMAKVRYLHGSMTGCLNRLSQVLDGYPDSQAVPESLLLRGRALHRQTGQTAHLRQAYQILSEKHPRSQWTEEASAYRLL